MTQTWEERFDKEFPSIESWSQRGGDYTEAPLPSIKAFIRSEINKAREQVLEEIETKFSDQSASELYIAIPAADWIKLKQKQDI